MGEVKADVGVDVDVDVDVDMDVDVDVDEVEASQDGGGWKQIGVGKEGREGEGERGERGEDSIAQALPQITIAAAHYRGPGRRRGEDQRHGCPSAPGACPVLRASTPVAVDVDFDVH